MKPCLIDAGTYPGFCSMKHLGVFLLPLYGMLVYPWGLKSEVIFCLQADGSNWMVGRGRGEGEGCL